MKKLDAILEEAKKEIVLSQRSAHMGAETGSREVQQVLYLKAVYHGIQALYEPNQAMIKLLRESDRF